jgi:hypothetical protein
VTQIYNVYCDESCHLEHDEHKVMVLGGVWCLKTKVPELNVALRDIRKRHSLPPDLEIKWTKVSPAQVGFYLELVDFFFSTDDLNFRALIVPDKTILRHDDYNQTHDDWYHKMYYLMLRPIIEAQPDIARYHIYVDLKDTWSTVRFRKLHEVLSSTYYDFTQAMIERVQPVRSHQVELLQLADLLVGIVSYTNRGLTTSQAKLALVERMRQRSGLQLTHKTGLHARKVNLFLWDGQTL